MCVGVGPGLCDQGIGRPWKGFGVCYSVPWAATEGFEWGQGCFQVIVFTLSFQPWSGGCVRRGKVGRVSIGMPSRKLFPFRG